MAKVQDYEEVTNGDTTTLRHPALGQIALTKVSGQVALNGSDFQHQNYVALTLFESRVENTGGHDFTYTGKQLVRFAMSEAQWATFVSSFGVGEGTPVTLERVLGDEIPRLPVRDRGQGFKRKGNDSIDKVLRELAALKEAVASDASGLSKAKRDALTAKVDAASRSIGDTLPFVAESFAEHVEKSVERGKVELQAFAGNMLVRKGLEAIARESLPLALEGPKADG